MIPELIDNEANLRRAMINRLITASLSEGAPVRDAMVERWRMIGSDRTSLVQLPRDAESPGH
jgi:hypothetical protein